MGESMGNSGAMPPWEPPKSRWCAQMLHQMLLQSMRCDAIRLHDQPFATGHGSSRLDFALQRQSVPPAVVMQTSRTLAAANGHYQRLNCSRVLVETRSRAVCVPMGRA